MRFTTLITLTSGLSLVSAHAVITAVVGTNGVTTTGFGVVNGTLRTGTDEQPFQTDTSVLKDLETDPCGATLRGGSIDIATSLKAMEAQGSGQLPSLSSNLSITMDLHQVNADGGGPFFAVVNTDGTGQSWSDATITQQAPGVNAVIRAGPNDAQLTVQLPSGTSCTGGSSGNACLVRISNGGVLAVSNGAGPFGGCLAVQNPDSASAAATTAAVAASTSAAAASTSTIAATKATTKKTFGKGKNAARSLSPAVVKRAIDDLNDLTGIVTRSLDLTVGDVDDIKTATGTAIDIIIDQLAGHNDQAATGGNSTSGISTANALISFQQSTDIKEGVKEAIAVALQAITNAGAVISNNPISPDDTAAANALARANIDNAVTTSVNAGNAGVGFVDAASVTALLGALTEINTSAPTPGESTVALTKDAFVSGATATAAAATVAVAASGTTAATATCTKAAKKVKAAKSKRAVHTRAGFHKRRLPTPTGVDAL
ncbi:hypothetical protein RQP46_004881 [Phenoliferia psychrophenolica]